MKQPGWKIPPHLRDRGSEMERMRSKIAELEATQMALATKLAYTSQLLQERTALLRSARIGNSRYTTLRHVGVVIMDDECKHLEGTDLDDYLDCRRTGVFSHLHLQIMADLV